MNPELSSPETLFTLDWRVRWLYPRLPRWRFRAPQSASLRLAHPPTKQPAPHGDDAPPPTPVLSPLAKFKLIKETDETCYWCARSIGTKVTIRGRTFRLRLQWDHVTPAHIGGAGDATNMVPSCHCCNGWKSGKVFASQADIRAFLEDRWLEELAAPIAEKPSAPEHIAAAEYANTARSAVRSRTGKRHTTHIRKPRVPATRPGALRFGSPGMLVRITSGSQAGKTGLLAGESREQEGWKRVLLGQQQVPWRFLPEQIAEA
jgi:hypothetical protein